MKRKFQITGFSQAQSQLVILEARLQELLVEEQKNECKSELELLIENVEEITVSDISIVKPGTKFDITINKKHLADLTRQCDEGILVVNKRGNIIETNGKLELLLGYSDEDLHDIVIKSIFPLVGKFENAAKTDYAFAQHICRLYARKKYQLSPMETTIFDNNGNTVFLQMKAALLKDTNGQLTGAVILFRDITERNKLKQEISKTKEFLSKHFDASKTTKLIGRLKKELEEKKAYVESIVESSTDGIIVTNTGGFIQSINTAFSALLNYPPKQLIGKHWAELYPLEDKEFVNVYGDKIVGGSSTQFHNDLEKINDLFNTGNSFFECYIKRKDDVLVPVECSLYWLCDDKGQRIEGVTILRDLTERKMVERKLNKAYAELQEAKDFLENIISTTVDGIIIADPPGSITRINDAVEKMLGYTQHELMEMHISELNPSSNKDIYYQLKDTVEKLFNDGRVMGYESIWMKKDGQIIDVELNAALLKDKDGLIIGSVIGVRDISERKKLEEMKNDFISNVSHELRTPLTSIKGSISNLLDGITGKLNNAQRDYLTIINNESDRLVRLINDLLDLNRLEAERIQLLLEEVDYISLVSQVVINLKDLTYEKGLDIELELPETEIYLRVDKDKINQVLVNLINNAIKFTEAGEIKIIVDNSKNTSITTGIIDSGIGIPKDELDKVFDKFYQITKPPNAKSRGTGLGLAISKSLVEMHGGKIWVESEEGKGSVFWFTLPQT
jgi:PAS domain S-box-containing protein